MLLEENNPEIYLKIGKVLLELKEPIETAHHFFTEGLKINPHNKPLQKCLNVTKTLVEKMNETHLEINQEIKELIENLNSRQESKEKKENISEFQQSGIKEIHKLAVQGVNIELTRVLQPHDPDKSKLRSFLLWSRNTQIKTSKIEIVYYGNLGVGVQAKEKISSDEALLSVPEDNLLNLDRAYRFNDFKKRTDMNKINWEGPKHTALAAFLLENRNKKSNWSPYFDMLPDKMHTNPMFFTEKELEYLKGTAFIAKILTQKSQMKRDYDNLILNMPEY